MTKTTDQPLVNPTHSDLTKAHSANEAASMVFPEIGNHFKAFWEQEEGSISQPSHLNILDLNDEFWALTIGPSGTPQNPIVYDQSENQFRRYQPTKGIYEPVSESAVVGALLSNLELCADFLPTNLRASSFVALKNRQRLKSVVERAKDLLAVEDASFQDRKHLRVPFTNGMLQIDSNQFYPSAPTRPIRESLPVKYEPKAKSEMFLKSFLAHILEPDDIDLLQRYLSQVLEGINHSQTILVLTGDAGWGKSSLMKILGSLVGWERVGVVRDQLFRDDCELIHYADKHLLYHPDMPTDFLNRKEASLFKQLVGGDPLWAEIKGSDRRMVLQGQYPIILACNGKPKIHLDQDTDAWSRRLVVLSFKKPAHEQHFGKMAELILRDEGPGILNWLLEGRAKLAKDKLQLTQTTEQKGRSASLLLASESPSAFVRNCLVKKVGGAVGMVDLYETYQTWCKELHLLPFSSKEFGQIVKPQIETTFGLKYRHDLASENGGSRRGWRGLAFGNSNDAQNGSNESEAAVARALNSTVMQSCSNFS